MVHMSKNLTTLDLLETRFTLITSIINRISNSKRISDLNLSAVRCHSTNKLGDLYTNLFNFDTVRMLVVKFRRLTDLILFRTRLTYESIAFL